MKEHEAILNALQRRDGAGLFHILRAHLRHKREEVLQAGFAETEGSELTLRIACGGLARRAFVRPIPRLAFAPLRCDNRPEDRS
ncbi:hypothetical protein [Bradyrhizobium japonicum]|uniref:hypothetical protein n=1 Tax=Bradyrhizobium japonicum TaxID=375 RepID=UPI0035D727AC